MIWKYFKLFKKLKLLFLKEIIFTFTFFMKSPEGPMTLDLTLLLLVSFMKRSLLCLENLATDGIGIVSELKKNVQKNNY